MTKNVACCLFASNMLWVGANLSACRVAAAQRCSPSCHKPEQVCFTGVTTPNCFNVAMTTGFLGTKPVVHKEASQVHGPHR